MANFFPQHYTGGQLLIEILVAISVFTILAAISSQALYVSMRGSTLAIQKDVSAQLLREMLEGARGATESSWQNLYGLTKSTGHYYPVLSGGAWVIASGDEAITLNGATYMRYVTVVNVSRDPSTRNIESVYNAAHDDPSTQELRGVVSATSTPTLTASVYVFRWRNKTCAQSVWSGSGASGVKQCPDTSYVSQTNITTGANLQLCSGGC